MAELINQTILEQPDLVAEVCDIINIFDECQVWMLRAAFNCLKPSIINSIKTMGDILAFIEAEENGFNRMNTLSCDILQLAEI